MSYQALHRSILLLRHPVLWIVGVFAGLFLSTGVYLIFSGMQGIFFAERLFVFSLIILPFFIAATYGTVRTDDFSVKNYIKEGFGGYFRILLPTFLIMAGAIFLLFLITMPTAIAGIADPVLFGGAFFLIFLPFLLLVFFYDTAAVFEEKKVFECIRRSFEVSFARPVQILGFFIVLLLFFFVIFTGFSIIWSGMLTEQFEPLIAMSEEELNSFAQNPEAVIAMLGEYGAFITAVMTFFGTMLFSVVLLLYKAIFYRDYLMGAVIEPVASEPVFTEPEGEYDEKGRWYKYS
jgi:hypothetical protein